MVGWVKLHRELLDKAAWKCSTAEQRSVLITILLLANHKPQQWIWKKKKFTCKPGQFVTSLKSLSVHSGASIKTVRGAIEKLENVEFIKNEATKSGRIITVCNWDRYQVIEKDKGKDGGNEESKEGSKGGATNKNDKEERKREEELFDEFRLAFPGRKNGLKSEIDNFVKKEKGWREVLPLLKTALENQKIWREQDKKNGVFVPQWKNLSTWLNQKCWTEEPPLSEVSKKPVTTSDIYMREHERQKKEWEDKNG